MRELRHSFLRGPKQVRVQTDLENRTSLGLTRQFRIDHFVRPATERAWLFHSSENIGTATPLPGLKRALNDNWRSGLHGFEGLGHSARINSKAVNRCGRETTCLEVLNVTLFMQST